MQVLTHARVQHAHVHDGSMAGQGNVAELAAAPSPRYEGVSGTARWWQQHGLCLRPGCDGVWMPEWRVVVLFQQKQHQQHQQHQQQILPQPRWPRDDQTSEGAWLCARLLEQPRLGQLGRVWWLLRCSGALGMTAPRKATAQPEAYSTSGVPCTMDMRKARNNKTRKGRGGGGQGIQGQESCHRTLQALTWRRFSGGRQGGHL